MKTMTGGEFVRIVKKMGRKAGIEVKFDAVRGKGSHGRLRYGILRTTIRHLKDDLKPGTLRAMCKQLGIDPKDL